MTNRDLIIFFVVLVVSAALTRAFAREIVPSNSEEVLVLGTHSFWRAHVTLRPELYGTAPNPRGRTESQTPQWREPAVVRGIDRKQMPVYPSLPPDQPHSPLPPQDWAQPDFDDWDWWRTPGPFFGPGTYGRWGQVGRGERMPYGLALVCVRGRFRVTNPARVKDLRLSLAFRGGVVVYLNGKEVARSHLPDGEITFETLADDYQDVQRIDKYGWRKVTAALRAQRDDSRRRDSETTPEDIAEGESLITHLESRIRRLEGVSLPASLLRKGINVLALEVHRSAIPPECPFCPCGLLKVELKSSSQKGIAPNTSRPQGLQVWTANILEDILDVDYGDPGDEIHPLQIVGTRNGTFSGQVIVGSDAPLKELRAQVSPLVRLDGKETIPTSHLKVFYMLGGLRLDLKKGFFPNRFRGEDAGDLMYRAGGFMDLAAMAPAEVPVKMIQLHKEGKVESEVDYSLGAVQPIWVSVKVPADALPGDYEGKVTIQVEGKSPIEVPIELRVCAWKLPAGRDYEMLMDFIESPESVALYYNVPLWSEEHFQLIGKSFELLSEIGNKSVYIPLISATHFGNDETMVRWVRQPDGTYTYDFSIMERYLDAFEKYSGKPRIVHLYVWDHYLGVGRKRAGLGSRNPLGGHEPSKAVKVSVVDPATGEVQMGDVPLYMAPGAEQVWKPLADELWERLKRRGLEKAAVLGIVGDFLVPQEYVLFWKKLLPEAPWAIHSHGLSHTLYDLVPVAYNVTVFNTRFGIDPGIKRYRGWQRKDLTTLYPRTFFPGSPRSLFRVLPEWNAHGFQHGIGRLPADFYRLDKALSRGSRLYNRYPMNHWLNVGIGKTGAWLGAGPEGPLPSMRFEMIREGVQECEARIFIEKALVDHKLRAKLGEALAEKCQRILDERTRYNIWVYNRDYVNYNLPFSVLPGNALPVTWYSGSGWQQRSQKLFTIAAQVTQALGL